MTEILSWNVNGIRACAGKGLFDVLAAESPDFLCVQEIKAQVDQLPRELLAPADGKGGQYRAWFASAKRRGYSGVAIYSKIEPRSVEPLGIDEFDAEGRALVADLGDWVLINAYFPNSQEAGARLDYKLRFCDAILAACDRIVASGRHVVVAGDYNIAHEPIDLANPESNEGNPGYLPEERSWFDKWAGSGYADSFRRLCPEPRKYTWWTYRVKGARERNIGWRLDYHCVDEGFMKAVRSATIRPEIMGSDHCPVGLELDL
jgi:exodeoxyribonuclease-3